MSTEADDLDTRWACFCQLPSEIVLSSFIQRGNVRRNPMVLAMLLLVA
jgi:hypothetical protein